MRIGIFDPYLDDGGGGEKYMMTVAEVLAKNNDVCVFWDNSEDFELVKKRFNLELESVSLRKNIFSRKTSLFKRLKESKKYDAIIVLSDGSLPLLRCKLFVHIQRPLEHVALSSFTKIKKKRVSAFFCNSKFTKKYIDKTFQINSLTIYPPVQIQKVNEKKENIVLHVGRFRVVDKTVGVRDFKKQFFMLKAFKEMVDEGLEKWKMIFAVSVLPKDEKDFEEMRDLAKNYPVEFVVNKTNKEIWEWYGKAKIYWHASGFGEDLEKNPEFAEHFGISTVEAMGAGVVPVVIQAGGQTEIVENGKNGFTWETLKELKEKTLRLVESEKLLEKLSDEAKKSSQKFSKEEFEKHINSMVNS